MIPLTIVAVAVLAASIRGAMSARSGTDTAFWSRMLFHLGLFAFVLGVLSQAIGLYQMMGVIEQVGGASPAIVMGGLRVSLIAPFYGTGIFIAAMLFRFALDGMARMAVR